MGLTQDSNLQMSLDVIDLRGKHCQIIVLRHLTLTHPNVVVARRRQSMLVVVVDSLIRVDHTCDLGHIRTSCSFLQRSFLHQDCSFVFCFKLPRYNLSRRCTR